MKLKNSLFIRNVLLLVGGTAVAQIILMVASPILTRVYSAGDFGALATLSAIVSILSLFSTLRYELSIPTLLDEQVAFSMLVLCFVLVGVVSSLIGVILYFLIDVLQGVVSSTYLTTYWYFIPLMVSINGVCASLNYWLIRDKCFSGVARGTCCQSISMTITKVVAGLLGSGVLGLMLGQFIGQLSGAANLIISALNRLRGRKVRVNLEELYNYAIEQYRYPAFSLGSALLNNMSTQIPVLLLAYLFGVGTAGLYTLSLQVLITPVMFLAQAISQVFFSNATRAKENGKITHETAALFRILSKIGIPLSVILAVILPEMFSFIFGSAWLEAGTYGQFLIPWILMVFITSPVTNLVLIFNKQKQDMYFQGCLLCLRIIAIILGWRMNSAFNAIALFGLVSFICWITYLFWILTLSGNDIMQGIGYLAREFFSAGLIVLPILVSKAISNEGRILSIGTVVTVVLIYWYLICSKKGVFSVEKTIKS